MAADDDEQSKSVFSFITDSSTAVDESTSQVIEYEHSEKGFSFIDADPRTQEPDAVSSFMSISNESTADAFASLTMPAPDSSEATRINVASTTSAAPLVAPVVFPAATNQIVFTSSIPAAPHVDPVLFPAATSTATG
jgi:hypothetical protein